MSKKLFLVAFLAISSAPFCGAMKDGEQESKRSTSKLCLVAMPDKEKLRELFSKQGLDYFMEKTAVIRVLAGEEKTPCGIEAAKHLLMSAYSNVLSGYPSFMKTNMMKAALASFDRVVNEIVQDFPEAKKQLQFCRDGFASQLKEQQKKEKKEENEPEEVGSDPEESGEENGEGEEGELDSE